MQRRQYLLTSAALTLPLAGCLGGDSEDVGGSEPVNTQTATADPTETDTADSTKTEQTTEDGTETDEEVSGDAEIVIHDHSLGFDDTGYSTYPYVDTTLENQGNAPSGEVALTIDWFDSDGGFLTDSSDRLVSLDSGETWKSRVYGILVDTEDIDDYDVTGGFTTEAPSVPEGVELVSSKLLAGNEVKVRGEVLNNTNFTIDYIEFHGKIYNSDGKVLGSVWTNELNIPSGGSWQVDPRWDGRGRIPMADSHKVVLDANVY